MKNFSQTILRILNDHISKIKNRKIDFSFVSKHCAIFWIKNSSFWGGEGFCMSLTRTWPGEVKSQISPWKRCDESLHMTNWSHLNLSTGIIQWKNCCWQRLTLAICLHEAAENSRTKCHNFTTSGIPSGESATQEWLWNIARIYIRSSTIPRVQMPPILHLSFPYITYIQKLLYITHVKCGLL